MLKAKKKVSRTDEMVKINPSEKLAVSCRDLQLSVRTKEPYPKIFAESC